MDILTEIIYYVIMKPNIFRGLLVTSFALFMGVSLYQVERNHDEIISEIESSQKYRLEIEKIENVTQSLIGEREFKREFEISPLGTAIATIKYRGTIKNGDTDLNGNISRSYVIIRKNGVAYAITGVFLIIFAATFASSSISDTLSHTTSNQNKDNALNKSNTAQAPETADEFLFGEIRRSENLLRGIYVRAYFTLFGGILMAFIGLLAFYATTPAYNNEVNITVYAIQSARPIGALIFIEAISWFLLRQYTRLISEHKYFYAIHLKRSNHFAATKILTSDGLTTEQMLMVTALISDNTTPHEINSVENQNEINENTIFALFSRIIDKLPVGTPDKK